MFIVIGVNHSMLHKRVAENELLFVNIKYIMNGSKGLLEKYRVKTTRVSFNPGRTSGLKYKICEYEPFTNEDCMWGSHIT